MKQCDLTKGFVVFLTIMITLFCGVMPSSWADECNDCEKKQFEGCYGFSHDGMMITPATGPQPVPMASVGVFYLDEMENDGIGILSGDEMVNFGGTSFPARISGTYTVKADCTGTAWICATQVGSEEGIESEIAFVITSKGEGLQMVTTKMWTPCTNNTPPETGNVVPINIVGTAKICDN